MSVINKIDIYLTEKVKFKLGYRVPSKAMKKKWKTDTQMELDYWTKELADLKKYMSKMGKGQPGGKAQGKAGIGQLKHFIEKAKEKIKKQKVK